MSLQDSFAGDVLVHVDFGVSVVVVVVAVVDDVGDGAVVVATVAFADVAGIVGDGVAELGDGAAVFVGAAAGGAGTVAVVVAAAVAVNYRLPTNHPCSLVVYQQYSPLW